MKKGFAVGFMLLLSVGLLVMGGSQVQGESAKPTTVSVKPSKLVVFVNHTFSVDIWIDNVVNTCAWRITLLWNRSILKCIKARVNTPIEWGGIPFDAFNVSESELSPDLRPTAFQFGPGIVNDYNDTYGLMKYYNDTYGLLGDYNNTYGLYDKCEMSLPIGCTPRTFSGSLSVVTLTFQALQTGTTALDFWRWDEHLTTIVASNGYEAIAHIEYDGWVHVRAPITMSIQHAQWLKR